MGIKSGQKRGTGWTATGRIIVLCETQTITCQPVDVWSFYLTTKASEIRISHIVNENDNDIGKLLSIERIDETSQKENYLH